MDQSETPLWLGGVIDAARRLEVEADDEIEELFERVGTGGGSAESRALELARFEQSAQLMEVTRDLAGLLWAEGEGGAPIDTIFEEPAARAALEAVAEARRRGFRRLATATATAAGAPLTCSPPDPLLLNAPPSDAPAPRNDSEVPTGGAVEGSGPLARALPIQVRASSTVPKVGGGAVAVAMVRRPATHAAFAGLAAAALMLFGRRIRRT